MSCAYDIDRKLYRKLCDPDIVTNPPAFARIYINGLHRYVTKLETQVNGNGKEIKLLQDTITLLQNTIRDKDEIITFLKHSNNDGTVSL